MTPLPGRGRGPGLGLRPRDRGAPHDPFFAALDRLLAAHGVGWPCAVVDLDRLDANAARVAATVARGDKSLRLVEKSLPCAGLLAHLMARTGTRRLMSFHLPFLLADAQAFPDADILLGKPLPVAAASAFYHRHRGPFEPARQLHWLIDTPTRLAQYRALARGQGLRLRVAIELDVGLHRGGVADAATLLALLDTLAADPEYLVLAGFMGYDPFVGMNLPRALGRPEAMLADVLAVYGARLDETRRARPGLWRDDLILNTGGSPSYRWHTSERLCNELAVGTGLLKPGHYDLPGLDDLVPALWIATPVLKAVGPVRLPRLPRLSRGLAWWDVNQRQGYFIYGGQWRADPVSPPGLRPHRLYGRSANQELLAGSPATALAVDERVFLRPHQSEGVLGEFGELLAVRGGELVARWPVMQG